MTGIFRGVLETLYRRGSMECGGTVAGRMEGEYTSPAFFTGDPVGIPADFYDLHLGDNREPVEVVTSTIHRDKVPIGGRVNLVEDTTTILGLRFVDYRLRLPDGEEIKVIGVIRGTVRDREAVPAKA